MKFIISKRARRHIEKIQAYWAENRTSAPALILDELAGADDVGDESDTIPRDALGLLDPVRDDARAVRVELI